MDISEEAAISLLAERLRWKMEHLDPTDDWERDWSALTERQRDFYALCVRAILVEADAVRSALRFVEGVKEIR